MFKRYRQFLIGFLIGALLFSTIHVSAAVQEYILTKSETKIIVDGTEFTDDSLPVLNYKGYNYIPAAVFKGICAKLGLSFEWVGEKKEIQIQTGKGEKGMATTVKQPTVMYETIGGKEYISAEDLKAYCKELYGNKFSVGYGKSDPTWANIYSRKGLESARQLISDNPRATSEEELIKSGVMLELPIEFINGKIYITKQTFEDIVLPFIDKWEAK